MNYKNIMLIALALMLAIVLPVSAGHVSDYENKYAPIVEEKNAMSDMGMVYGNLKSGQVLEGGTIFTVCNDLTPLEPKVYEFDRSGKFDGYFAPGTYTVTLPQGTGSAAGVYSKDAGFVGNLHPEVAHITVVAGKTSYFTFIGNSVATIGRPDPYSASIDAYFGCGDIELKWIKVVKTGSHWVEPYFVTLCHWETVIDTPAYDEVIPAVTHQDYEAGHVHAKKVQGHASHDFTYNGQKYQIVGTQAETAFIVGNCYYGYCPNVRLANMVTIIDVEEQTVHHPATTHNERVCEQVQRPGYWQDEYGFEFFIEIDGAKIDITNPNNDPVNVGFQMDINYWIDRMPWNNNAEPCQIVPVSTTYYGTIGNVGSGVTTYHGFLQPDIDDAVEVLGYDGLMYHPFISNEIVTSTEWA